MARLYRTDPGLDNPGRDIPKKIGPAALLRWRNTVLDWEIVVEDCRQDLHHALDAWHDARRERDRSTRHLAYLLELSSDCRVHDEDA